MTTHAHRYRVVGGDGRNLATFTADELHAWQKALEHNERWAGNPGFPSRPLGIQAETFVIHPLSVDGEPAGEPTTWTPLGDAHVELVADGLDRRRRRL